MGIHSKLWRSHSIISIEAKICMPDTCVLFVMLMVFTIVTVIFLPLSFLAAFFAINVKEFPRNNSGEQETSLAYVSKYVFGVGVIIAFLCVAVAWSAEQIALWSKDVTA